MTRKKKQVSSSTLLDDFVYPGGADEDTIPFGFRFRGQEKKPCSFRLPSEALDYIDAACNVFSAATNRSQALVLLLEIALIKMENECPELYEALSNSVND